MQHILFIWSWDIERDTWTLWSIITCAFILTCCRYFKSWSCRRRQTSWRLTLDCWSPRGQFCCKAFIIHPGILTQVTMQHQFSSKRSDQSGNEREMKVFKCRKLTPPCPSMRLLSAMLPPLEWILSTRTTPTTGTTSRAASLPSPSLPPSVKMNSEWQVLINRVLWSGYGNFAAETFYGRFFCLLFGIIGIPFMLSVLADVGGIFAGILQLGWDKNKTRLTLLARKLHLLSPGSVKT